MVQILGSTKEKRKRIKLKNPRNTITEKKKKKHKPVRKKNVTVLKYMQYL